MYMHPIIEAYMEQHWWHKGRNKNSAVMDDVVKLLRRHFYALYLMKFETLTERVRLRKD